MALAKYLPSKQEHPIRAAAVLTLVIYAPAVALLFLVLEKDVLFIAAFSAVFLVVMFILVTISVKWDNRLRAARDLVPAGAPVAISDAMLGEPWNRRAMAGLVGATITVWGGSLLVVIAESVAGGIANVSTSVIWLIVGAVAANELCRMRERQLARALREWSECSPVPPLVVWITEGSDAGQARLEVRDDAIAVHSLGGGIHVFPKGRFEVEPGTGARVGRQVVLLSAPDAVLALTPVGPRDPASWPHLAPRPKSESITAGPMWELIRILSSNSSSRTDSAI